MNRRDFFKGLVGLAGVAAAFPKALLRKTAAAVSGRRKTRPRICIETFGGGGAGGSAMAAGPAAGGSGRNDPVVIVWDMDTGEVLGRAGPGASGFL